MKKKILVSLMLAAPGLSVLANVDMGNQPAKDWIPNGNAGEDFYPLGDFGLGCSVGTGKIEQTLKNLPKGTYIVDLKDGNNVVFSFSQNGKQLTVKEVDGLQCFDAEAGDVTVTIQAENMAKPGGWSFQSFQLILKYDFAIEANALQEMLNSRNLGNGISSATLTPLGEGTKELDDKYDALVKAYNSIKAKITQISNGDDAEPATQAWKDLIALYSNEKLYNDVDPRTDGDMKSDLAEEIRNLKVEVNSYNTLVKEYNNSVNNTNSKNSFLQYVQNLREDLAKLRKDIQDKIADKNYVNGYKDLSECLAKTNDIEKQIDTFEQNIKSVFADENLTKDLTAEINKLNAENRKLSGEISDLRLMFNDDIADNDAYQQFLKLREELTSTYNTKVQEIGNFRGVSGMENVYVNKCIPAWLQEIEDIYQTGITSFYGFKLDGPQKGDAQRLPDANNGIKEDAQSYINQILDAVARDKAVVDDQNAQMTSIRESASDLTEKLENVMSGLTVPSIYQEEYDQKVQEIKDLIAALISGSENEYKDQKLNADAHQAEIDKIDEKIKDLGKFVEKFTDANKMINDLDKAIEEITKLGNLPGTDYTVVSKFGTDKEHEGTFKNIFTAIQGLQADENGYFDPAEVDYLNQMIAKLLPNAKQEWEVYDNINKSILATKAAVEGLLEYAEGVEPAPWLQNEFNKIVVPDNKTVRDQVIALMKNNEDYKNLEKTLADNTAARDEAAASDGQISWNKGEDLWAAIKDANETADEINTDAAALKLAFSEKVTKEINWVNVSKQLTNERKAKLFGTGTNPIVFEGKDEMKARFEALQAKLARIQTDLDNANALRHYESVDRQLRDLNAEIAAFDKKYQNVLDNESAYNEICAQLFVSREKLDDLYDYNQEASVDGGKDFFAEIIGMYQEDGAANSKGTLYEQYAALQAAADKAHSNWDNEKTNAAALLEGILGNIAGFDILVAKTHTDCIANNEAHADQLVRWEQVRSLYNVVHDQLVELAKGNDLFNDQLENVENLWNNTSDEDLDMVQVMALIFDAYGFGQSVEKNTEIKNDLDWIEAQLKIYVDKYADNVTKYNQNIVDGCDWSDKIDDMWAKYREGVRRYQAYVYPGESYDNSYFAVIEPYIRALWESQDADGWRFWLYNDVIKNLLTEEENWIKEQNKNLVLITPEEFTEKFINRALTAISEMDAKIFDMNTKADAKAEAYYAEKHQAAADLIAEADAKLKAAGIEKNVAENCVKAAKEAMAQAELRYKDALDSEAIYNETRTLNKMSELPGIEMFTISNLLDFILDEGTIDLQKAAKDSWKQVYPTDDELDALRKVITEECPDADPELKEEQLAIFDSLVEEIKALGAEVDDIDEGLIDVYADYKEKLDDLMSQLNNAVDNVKESQQNAVDEINKYTEMTKDLGTLTTTLNALDDFIKGFSQAYLTAPARDNIRTVIANLQSYIEQHRGKLTKEPALSYVAGQMRQISNALSYQKVNICVLEYNYVDGALAQSVRTAFDNARTWDQSENDSKNAAELDELNAWIGRLQGVMNALGNNIDFSAPDYDFAGYKATIMRYENEYCQILQKLDEMYHGDQNVQNPSSEAIARLNSKYDEIAQALAGGQESLSGCLDEVKEAFAGRYEELASQLEALKADWSDDDVDVISFEANYNYELNKLNGQITTLGDEISVAEEKAQAEKAKREANQAAYERLLSQYEALESRFEAVKEEIAGYGEKYTDAFKYNYTTIQNMLDAAKEDLEERYADVKLDADSKLIKAEKIELRINSLELDATRAYATDEFRKAENAMGDARVALQQDIVPEVLTELKSRYNELETALEAIRGHYNNSDYETTVEIYKEAQRIAREAAALISDANNNSFVPGDVAEPYDGQVTALDILTLANWIVEDKTYEDIYAMVPRAACAADLIGDQQIDIADVVIDIKLALGEGNGMAKARRHLGSQEGDNSYTLTLLGKENGVSHYALAINNPSAFVAGQLKFNVNGNGNVTEVKGSERLADHSIIAADSEFGGKRVVILSMGNAVIEGTEGDMLYIDVEGNGKLEVEQALFSDSNAVKYEVHDANKSIVDTLLDGVENVGTRIYNAAGQMLNKVQKGINIIVNGNGKASKEIRK